MTFDEYEQIYRLMMGGMQAQPLALQEAQEPLTGFLGPQRTPTSVSTWIHEGVNIGGLEWLIPLLVPGTSPEDIKKIISGEPLSNADHERLVRAAIDFAVTYERQHPGTFAKYQSVPEADAAAQGASKQLVARPLPSPPPRYPGRDLSVPRQ